MLRNNIYAYEDDYMYFTFNGIHSSTYNLIQQNDLEDLKIYADRDTKVDFLQPKYQTGQYLLGVSNPQRKFPLKLVAENVTRVEIKKIIKWLEAGTVGTLSFDYSPDWQYDVVVSEMKDPNIYVLDDENHFIASFEVTFTTIEQSIAYNKFNSEFTIDANSIGSGQQYAGFNNSYFILANFDKNSIFCTRTNSFQSIFIKVVIFQNTSNFVF